MIVLEYKSGPNAGLRVELDSDSVVLGRAKGEVDLVILDDRASKKHARLSLRGEVCILEDLGSSNGTALGAPGSNRIEGQVRLAPGQSFSIGMTELELVACGAASLSEDAATILDMRAVPRSAALVHNQTSMVVRQTDCVIVNSLREEGDPDDVLAAHEGRGRLCFLTGPHKDRYVFLGRLKVLLGRAEDNNVPLYDPLAEPRHAVILSDGDNFKIRPVSASPVLLNGQPVLESKVLGHGDIITLGASDIEFQAPGIDIERDDPMATVAIAMPRFAFSGEVRMQPELSVGRDPSSDLFLDDRRVERRHAQLYHQHPEFRIRDLSSSGTLVNGQRVVDAPLQDGDSVRLGAFELRVGVQALRCSIEVLPPEADLEVPRFAQDVEVASPFMTMYRLPTAIEQPAAGVAKKPSPEEDKHDRDRRSVLWVPPDDVERTARTPLVLAVGVLASLLVAYASVQEAGPSALSGRSVSGVHSGPEFLSSANAGLGASDPCRACHDSTASVSQACEGCHESHSPRPGHETLEHACQRCHQEHVQGEQQTALLDGLRCAECHLERHQAFMPLDWSGTKEDPPARAGFAANLKADLAFDREERQAALHAKHEALQARCTACHMTPGGEEREPGQAYRACFGCHGPENALASTACADCHREHGEEWATPLDASAQLASSTLPSPWAAALGLLGLLAFTTAAHRFARRRRREREAERRETEASAAPPRTDGVVECGGSGRGIARKLPRVSPNKCTGSGDCADACPYDVLHMVDSLPQVLRPELCHECTTCVAVCGPQALVMAVPGEPSPMISVPALDANFQTGLGDDDEGIYVIGEASGKPLVKNANNLGRWVVEHMISEGFGPGSAQRRGFDHEVIVIGGGPAGLSAALSAQREKLSYVLLEKGPEFAATIHGYPKRKKLMASPAHIENLGPLPVWDTTREEVLARWEQEISSAQLQIRPNEPVLAIEPEGLGFVVRTESGRYRGLRVVIAPGTRGDPRRLGKPGDQLPKVLYRLADPDMYDEKDCMVVGGGDSALEAAIALAEAHGGSNRVSIVYRGDSFARAKKGNQTKIQALVAANRLSVFMESNPLEVTERSVFVERSDKSRHEVPNDVLFCMLGANPPTQWLESLGIEVVQKPSDWDPGRSDRFAFKNFSES